jgi:putative nucleotidyltransferase with HDIG domain
VPKDDYGRVNSLANDNDEKSGSGKISDLPSDSQMSELEQLKGRVFMDATQIDNQIEAPDYRDKNGEYIPISIEGLSTGLATDLDLFTRAGDAFFVIKPKNNSIEPRLLSRIKTSGLPYVYIHKSDREKYQQRLEAQVSKVISDPKRPIREKAGILTDLAVELVDQLFTDPGNPKTIESARHLTQETVLFISQSKHAFLHLVELSNHDHYTYAHSVGVAAYTIALAPEVMKLDPKTLAEVGLAAFLHDIGKCMVDPAIINKKGPLNDEEWAVMKKHPEYGSEIIRRHKNMSPIIALSAEGHHENLLGSGYPKGLVAQKIDPIVRIISLTDAFSALTTKRSYSTPRDSVTALKLIKENLNKKFDTQLFNPFVKLFLEPQKRAA